MKILALAGLLAGITIFPVSGVAQNTNIENPLSKDTTNTNSRTVQPEPNQPESARGDWALQFQIDNNFTLRDFSGTLISFQKTLSDRNAVRFGLSLSGGYNEQKNNPTQKTTTGKFHLGASMNYLWFAHVSKEIRFYYGFGPVIAFRYDHTKNSQNSGVTVTKHITTSEGIGLDGVIGVEWFVRPRISLLAEYVPALTGTHTNTVNKTSSAGVGSKTKSPATDIQFGPQPVRFGVSVYF